MINENHNYAYISSAAESNKTTVDLRLNLIHTVDLTKYTMSFIRIKFQGHQVIGITSKVAR